MTLSANMETSATLNKEANPSVELGSARPGHWGQQILASPALSLKASKVPAEVE